MNRNNALKKLVLAALFVALDLLFTRVFCVYLMGGAERVSLQTLASAVCGWALGPWWGAGVAAAADLLGSAVGTSGLSFFPGFTLTAALRGLTYGLLLYRKPVTFPRCLAASAAVSILWGLLLNAVWLSFYMGKNFWAWTVAKGPLKLLLVPVYGYLIYLTLRGLQKSGLEKHL